MLAALVLMRSTAAHHPTAVAWPQDEQVWFVLDTSTNGTYINGERLIKGEPRRINPGDKLRLSTPPVEVVE